MVNRESFYFLSTIELLYQSYCSFYIVIDEYYERGELFVFFEFCDIEELYLEEYTGNRLGHIVKVGQIVYNYVIKRYYGKKFSSCK